MEKKLLAILLSFVLVIGVVPVSAFAADTRKAGEIVSGDWSYTLDHEEHATITGYQGNASALTVPAEIDGHAVTAVGEYAFEKNLTVHSIEFPESVESIGRYAFSGCTALQSVRLPEEMESIGNSAFLGCAALQGLTLPEGIKSIGDYLCSGCVALRYVTMPESLERIGQSAFLGCKLITRLTLPNMVSRIGDRSFENCTGLRSLVVEENANAEFQVKMGESAFSGCISLTEINLPSNLNSMGGRAFSGCTSLRSVTLPEGVKSIGHYAFSGCTALQNLTLPESVVELGGCLIENTAVRNIQIPQNVAVCAFAPGNGGYNGPLANCGTLKTVVFEEGIEEIPAYICASHDYESQVVSVTLPSTVKKIGNYAFYKCSLMQTVQIPSSVTEIGQNAFNGCKELRMDGLPEGVEQIGMSAFYGCSAITGLTLPNTVKAIGDYAFENCTGLERITVEENSDTEFEVKIGGNAFNRCTSLTEINLSPNVKSVGGRAFEGCEALESVVLPEGVEDIGHYAFSGCTALENITLPESLTTLGGCFIENTAIGSIVIPKNVTKCNYTPYSSGYNGPLANCDTLSTVTFAEGMTAIPEYICASGGYTSQISTVNIPGSVKSVGDYALHNCNNLSAVNYSGATEEDWKAIDMGAGNDSLTNATQQFHDHEYDDGVVTPPTCTRQGYTTYTCSACGSTSRDQFTRALGHTPVTDAAKAATCTEDGLTEGRHCSVCRSVLLAQKKIKATGHKAAGEGVVVTPASCTKDGTRSHTCRTCGEKFTEAIPATGHDYGNPVETTPATCGSEGIRTYTCANCGDIRTETVPALSHNYVPDVIEPGCTEDGYTLYTCSNCGDSFQEDFTQATGHHYEMEEQEPTCTLEGGMLYTCTNCGDCYLESSSDALGHNFDEGIVTTPPTETSEGVKTYTCARCGDTKTEAVPPLAHTHHYDNGTITKEASCTEPGVMLYRCGGCEDCYTQEIPAAGHQYELSVTTPSCTEEGFTSHTCTVCGHSYQTDPVKPAGHAFDEGIITVFPTDKTDGIKLYTCTVCGETKEESISAMDHTHTYDEGMVTKEASCTKAGEITYTCTECKSTDSREIPPLGHTYEVQSAESSCVAPGKKTYICTACGDTYSESFPKTAHALVYTPAKAATCAAFGSQAYYTCTSCKKIFLDAAASVETSLLELRTATTAHVYQETVSSVAAPGRNGSILQRCMVCGASDGKAIYAPAAIVLSKTACAYTGKQIKPSLTVTDSSGSVISPGSYTVSYSGNKKVGTAKVHVAFHGNYSGALEKTFSIIPKGTSLLKLTAGSKGFSVKWKKKTSQVKGYEIQFASSKKFTKKTRKVKKVKKNSVTTLTINAKAKKKYYVRIRTFQNVKGKTYYSGWSKVKKVTTKK